MDIKSLSDSYYLASNRASDVITELYEELFPGPKGEPETRKQVVIDKLNSYKRKMRIELDLIKSAVEEYEDTNPK